MPRSLVRLAVAGLLAAAAIAPPAAAAGLDDVSDQWLPASDGAEWVYAWNNSDYQPAARTEKYVVQSRNGTAFRLRWDEVGAGPYDTPSAGTVDFRYTDAGLVNLNYQSTQPPPQFPILCASATSCGNSVAGTMYLLIWGTRSPTLAEPLLQGTRWNSLGGAGNDVARGAATSGSEKIVVPAFPQGVEAAKVEGEVTQAGAVGDPFGCGRAHRLVGARRRPGEDHHAPRGRRALPRRRCSRTNLKPLPLPADVNLLPLNRGDTATFRWRNSKHMKAWSTQSSRSRRWSTRARRWTSSASAGRSTWRVRTRSRRG